MKDFLFEIFSEEIPAFFQKAAKDQLLSLVRKETANILEAASIETFVTPRRLSFILHSVQKIASSKEIQGPMITGPLSALEEFSATLGVMPAQCFQKTTSKGVFWTIAVKDCSIEKLLIILCDEIIKKFSWPKQMRWDTGASWIRPIRRFVSLYGDKPLIWNWQNIMAGSATEGHRFAKFWNKDKPLESGFSDASLVKDLNSIFIVKTPKTYEEQLRENFVILKQEERCERIKRSLDHLAASCYCRPFDKGVDGLIHENAALTEWPTGLLCDFDQSFLELPSPVITTVLKVHQRCFPLVSVINNELAPKFIVISNGIYPGDEVKKGYERVVRARLSDALFFWQQDKKKSLFDFVDVLKKRIFLDDLGSIYDKVKRLETLAPVLAEKTDNLDKKESLIKAAYLSKSDLVTTMVGEFPSLQGVMGRYYAKAEGMADDVAFALEHQYKFQADADRENTSFLGGMLAVLDAIDSLVGLFALGRTPTGSKDPMALRRAATTIIRFCLSNEISFSINEFIGASLQAYQNQGFLNNIDSLPCLANFFMERLRFILEKQGIPSAYLKAVLDPSLGDDLYGLSKQAKILKNVFEDPAGQAFLKAYGRVYSMATRMTDSYYFSPEKLDTPQEQALLKLLTKPMKINDIFVWIEPINDFFDNIRVADGEKQPYRLGLLHEIVNFFKPLGNLFQLF